LSTRDPIEVGIGLGGNVGDSRARIRDAIEALRERNAVAITAVSSIYRTAPICSTW
jgi:2-amino-4-hydroxy-6-hydroxymethyldihydropteridine diphosphokinase